MKERGVDYVILYVEDLQHSVAFYRDVVGLPFKFSDDAYAEFEGGGVKFGLFPSGRLADLLGEDLGRGVSHEIVILVDDVDSEAERLASKGVRVLEGPVDRAWGHRTLHFTDPDGYVVEFAQEIPRGGDDG